MKTCDEGMVAILFSASNWQETDTCEGVSGLADEDICNGMGQGRGSVSWESIEEMAVVYQMGIIEAFQNTTFVSHLFLKAEAVAVGWSGSPG